MPDFRTTPRQARPHSRVIARWAGVLAAASLAGCGSGEEAKPTETKNPIPVATTVTPDIAQIGGAGTVVRVSGSGFVSSSIIRVDGQDRATTVVSARELSFVLNASDTDSIATRAITVYNGPPGGGVSQSLTFGVEYPAPVLTSIAPAVLVRHVPARDTMTLIGTGFTPRSTLRVGVTNVAATYVSPTQLRFVPAFDVLAGGSYSIAVVNPSPGGGTSTLLGFSVRNPAPTISAVTPDSALEGASATAVTLTGRDFFPGMSVAIAGNPRATLVTSNTTAVVTLPPEDLAVRQGASVVARNLEPTDGASNIALFKVIGRPPVITALQPDSAVAGRGGVRLQVVGRDFNPLAMIVFNGSSFTTTVISPTLLEAIILPSALSSPQTVSVTVQNGGGLVSTPASFRIVPQLAKIASVRVLDLVTSDMEWIPSVGRLYASVISGADAGSVVGVTPSTGAITDRIGLGSTPGELAVSSDEKFLFAARAAESSIARINLSTGSGSIDLNIGIRADARLGTVYPEDLVTLPGSPRTVIASLRRSAIVSPRHAGVAVFDDGIERRVRAPASALSTRIESGGGSVVYGYDNETTEYGVRRYSVTDSGLVVTATRTNFFTGYGAEIKFAAGRIYSDRGLAFDATTFNQVGGFTFFGPLAVNPPLGRSFIYFFNRMVSINLTDLSQVDEALVDLAGETAVQVVQIAADAVAVRTVRKIFIVRGSLFLF